MSKISLLAFDMDGTISVSKTPLDEEISATLAEILRNRKIAVITGADLPQLEKQVIIPLQKVQANIDNVLLLPTCGSKFFYYVNGKTTKMYSEDLSLDEKSKIFNALEHAINQTGCRPEKIYGEQIEDRGTQITFSAIGQDCPVDIKSTWDPDMTKRKAMKKILDVLLPDFDIKIAGLSSIDITRKGIDKKYGMMKLIEYTNIPTEEIIFFGDKLVPDGNDYPVIETGVRCILVQDHHHTNSILREIISKQFEY